MRKVLFVDDEPRILQGLEAALRRYRKEWKAEFVCGGQAALDRLRSDTFDVIVSDMRMPGIDGAALLTRVRDEHPAMVRVVLSGQTDVAVAKKLMTVAHQFLAKPSEAAAIYDVVERACALHGAVHSERLRAIIGKIDQLPSNMSSYTELKKTLEDPNASMIDAARVVEREPGLCAKVLQIVNSAFFSLPRKVTRVDTAVSCLGTETLLQLTLALEVFAGFEDERAVAGFSLAALQRHALLAARIAARLAPDRADEAMLGGMFHDIGLVVLASKMTDDFERAVVAARSGERTLREVEVEIFGASHGEIGAYLLSLWGLPYGVVEAVAKHHAPVVPQGGGVDVVGAVHIADALATELSPADASPCSLEGLDASYIEVLGAAARLDEWRATARAVLGSGRLQ